MMGNFFFFLGFVFCAGNSSFWFLFYLEKFGTRNSKNKGISKNTFRPTGRNRWILSFLRTEHLKSPKSLGRVSNYYVLPFALKCGV